MKPCFKFRSQTISFNEPTKIAGIVNVTPDSFSDGGHWFGKEAAVKHALELIDQGADMLDIGGESTRPGSTYVQIQEEIDRVIPVIKSLKEKTDIPLSIDTWKAPVAKAAIDAGIDMINDITGFLGDSEMAQVVSQSNVGAILMFNPVIARPNHPGSKIFPHFGEGSAFTEQELSENLELPITELMIKYFKKGIQQAQKAGLPAERLILDPGIGFGLTMKENLQLIQHINIIHDLGYSAYLGVSRKRFIQHIIGDLGYENDPATQEGFANRDLASSYLSAIAQMQDVQVVRTHSIKEHRLALAVASHVHYSDKEDDINFAAYK